MDEIDEIDSDGWIFLRLRITWLVSHRALFKDGHTGFGQTFDGFLLVEMSREWQELLGFSGSSLDSSSLVKSRRKEGGRLCLVFQEGHDERLWIYIAGAQLFDIHRHGEWFESSSVVFVQRFRFIVLRHSV